MKLCPSCHTPYADDTLSYCLNDGTPLVKESSSQNPQSTLVLPAFQGEPNRQTQRANPNAQTGQQPHWITPTSQKVPVAHSKRSLTPWIIGGGILLLGIIGIGLVIALAISGARNNQSTTSDDSSVSSNSSINQGSNSNEGRQNISNTNQTQSNTSSSPPYAAFAGRTGRYEGPGLNTTYNVRGTIRLDITTINANSGYVSTMLTSSGDLCGDAPLTGKLTQDGKMNLSGKLTCKENIPKHMTARCQFTTTDTLTCTYTLTNPRSTPATGRGNFKVTKH